METTLSPLNDSSPPPSQPRPYPGHKGPPNVRTDLVVLATVGNIGSRGIELVSITTSSLVPEEVVSESRFIVVMHLAFFALLQHTLFCFYTLFTSRPFTFSSHAATKEQRHTSNDDTRQIQNAIIAILGHYRTSHRYSRPNPRHRSRRRPSNHSRPL